MLDDELLLDFMQSFYGYGDYGADVWFVGMEEGGAGSPEGVSEHLEHWRGRGRSELEDLREFQVSKGNADFFVGRPKLQRTWAGLARIMLADPANETATEQVREFQANHLGQADRGSDRRIVAIADQWLFKSETYDNCNCAVNCGCQFNLASTHGYCQSAFVGNIVEGHFNDTPRAGLNWAGLYKWPGEIAEGNGKRQIVIDERADEAQRVALETIVSGGACEPSSNFFSVFASTCSEFCETLFLPIDLEADLERRTATVEIPGIMTSVGGPIINEFNGESFHVALARPSGSFEFTYAEIRLGTTSVTGDMEMAFEDSWAHFCVHHFNRDGLVRERSRLTAWLGE